MHMAVFVLIDVTAVLLTNPRAAWMYRDDLGAGAAKELSDVLLVFGVEGAKRAGVHALAWLDDGEVEGVLVGGVAGVERGGVVRV